VCCVWGGGGVLNKLVLNRSIWYISSQLNPLYRIIGHVLPQFNLVSTDGRHFILWFCLLLLVGGWLRFKLCWSVLANTVIQQNSNQGSNNECRSTSHHYCNFQSSNCAVASWHDICAEGSWCDTWWNNNNGITKIILQIRASPLLYTCRGIRSWKRAF